MNQGSDSFRLGCHYILVPCYPLTNIHLGNLFDVSTYAWQSSIDAGQTGSDIQV